MSPANLWMLHGNALWHWGTPKRGLATSRRGAAPSASRRLLLARRSPIGCQEKSQVSERLKTERRPIPPLQRIWRGDSPSYGAVFGGRNAKADCKLLSPGVTTRISRWFAWKAVYVY